ncbi:MAG: hypothetical protein WA921_08145 [Ahrensia sp.]
MLKFLFQRKLKEGRLDRAVLHSHNRDQQVVIRGRAGKIIADQRAKSLQGNSDVGAALSDKR